MRNDYAVTETLDAAFFAVSNPVRICTRGSEFFDQRGSDPIHSARRSGRSTEKFLSKVGTVFRSIGEGNR